MSAITFLRRSVFNYLDSRFVLKINLEFFSYITVTILCKIIMNYKLNNKSAFIFMYKN